PVAAGEAVVVDAGPEPEAVDRCLRGLRVLSVPLLVITHFHADHVGGLAGVARGRRVGVVALPGFDEPAAGARLVLAGARTAGVEVIHPAAGWRYVRGDLALTVLGPTRPLAGTRSDPNNNSLIVRAVLAGSVSVLLAGDAETEEQQELLAEVGGPALRSDVLKVAHHGSAYQHLAFLDAVRPAVALVSVGADNDYGHPNAAVLARLSHGGAWVLRTDVDGDLAVARAATGLAVITHPP
ncbi:MAG: ComEC/Rec2 family competence protein, partial [Micromonosporaceae bacterium]